jgi:hypothetical protein
MIQLRSDCLVFEVKGGDKIPCSVEQLTIEVLSESLGAISPEVIQQAARAVLHYFKDDLGRETVTVDEFTAALEKVLSGLGFQVHAGSQLAGPGEGEEEAEGMDSTAEVPVPVPVAEADLEAMAGGGDEGLEMAFYHRLRGELRTLLSADPKMVRFRGLRPCAKRLARVRRWCPRSEQVRDEIVRFLRDCWSAEHPRQQCALVVK